MVPKEVDYLKIGQRVKKLRTEKGLKQAELAEMVQCSNNHLSHIETAQCKVSLGMLLKLSYALEVSLDYFVLDTPFARPEAIINETIAPKLAKCNAATLVAVSQMIDTLLAQQDALTDL